MSNININVNHVTRVEGHGNIIININNGTIERCDWQVPESPRFFEAMIRERHYSEVARVVSRICGICSIGHSLASVKATENALGITVSEQTKILRTLLKNAENFDSHVLHILFLAAPDLIGVKSIFPLVATHGDVVKKALALKRFSHEWGSLIGGRTTHPTTVIPGGFTETPTRSQIETLRNRFANEVLPELNFFIGLVESLLDRIPVFSRETEYMSLFHEDSYALYSGSKVQSMMPDGKSEKYLVNDYLKITNEYITDRSTAKYTKNKMQSFMVGALARFNNNFSFLHEEAKNLALKFGMKPLCFNPYFNTVAQLIEIVHLAYESLELCEKLLLGNGLKEEKISEPTKFASGIAAVEVPRGILYHQYEYNNEGICIGGDCVIPTNQNHGNIQLDFEKMVPEMLAANKTEKEMELQLEMLVRAYDPCISCSTHYLDITFK